MRISTYIKQRSNTRQQQQKKSIERIFKTIHSISLTVSQKS